jgi:tetratricopeptide (TPR) repeat protein
MHGARGLAAAALLVLSGCATLVDAPLEPQVTAVAADEAYEAGENERAVELYLAHLKDEPDDVQAWFRLGNAYTFSGNLNAATAAFRHVLALEPAHARARHNLGLIHIELGVDALLNARRELPAVDAQSAAAMQYLACVMEIFMGRPNPESCQPDAQE